MTEETAPLQARLRYGARNIHSIGPDHAAGLLQAAAELIDAQLEALEATEREDVSRALDLLDELRNTAIPVARLREEMLKPAREYLKARLVALGG